MKKIHIARPASQEELNRKIRRTWTVNPVTQVKPNKKHYTRKVKHKGNDLNF